MTLMPLSRRVPVNGPGDAGEKAGPPQLAVPVPIVNSIPPIGIAGGGQPRLSVVVDVVDVTVVVGIGDVDEELLEVLVVLVVVVVGFGGQPPGAGAFFALNLPITSWVTVPPNVVQ